MKTSACIARHIAFRFGRFAAVGAAAITIVSLAACTELGAWDDAERALRSDIERAIEWTERRFIAIDQASVSAVPTVTESVSDFPVMVRIPPDSTGDLAFYAEEYVVGASPLDHSISAVESDGTRIAWVRLPTLDPAAGGGFWAYSGANDSGSAENPGGVWKNSYVLVLHLEESSGEYLDSSGHGNHAFLSPFHTRPTTVAGRVGRGAEYRADGEDSDAIIIPNSPSIDTMAPMTATVLHRADAEMDDSRIFSKGRWYLSVDDGPAFQFKSEFRFSNLAATSTAPLLRQWAGLDIAENSWETITLSHSGANVWQETRIYLNDVAGGTQNQNNSAEDGPRASDGGTWLVIGNGDWAGSNRAPDGVLDEVRIARAERSRSWISLERLSMIDQLVTVGAVQEP